MFGEWKLHAMRSPAHQSEASQIFEVLYVRDIFMPFTFLDCYGPTQDLHAISAERLRFDKKELEFCKALF